jgi:hypothetical protein
MSCTQHRAVCITGMYHTSPPFLCKESRSGSARAWKMQMYATRREDMIIGLPRHDPSLCQAAQKRRLLTCPRAVVCLFSLSRRCISWLLVTGTRPLIPVHACKSSETPTPFTYHTGSALDAGHVRTLNCGPEPLEASCGALVHPGSCPCADKLSRVLHAETAKRFKKSENTV